MNELFDLPGSPSPRLAWLRRHGLTLVTSGAKHECVLDAENTGKGDTADEACIDFCLKTRLPHWNE